MLAGCLVAAIMGLMLFRELRDFLLERRKKLREAKSSEPRAFPPRVPQETPAAWREASKKPSSLPVHQTAVGIDTGAGPWWDPKDWRRHRDETTLYIVDQNGETQLIPHENTFPEVRVSDFTDFTKRLIDDLAKQKLESEGPYPKPDGETMMVHDELMTAAFSADLEAVFDERAADLESVRPKLRDLWLSGCGRKSATGSFFETDLRDVFGEKAETMSETLKTDLRQLYDRGSNAGTRNRAALCVQIARRNGTPQDQTENYALQLMDLPDDELRRMARKCGLHRFLDLQENPQTQFGLNRLIARAEEAKEEGKKDLSAALDDWLESRGQPGEEVLPPHRQSTSNRPVDPGGQSPQ